MVIITGYFYLRDHHISKEDKDWIYPQIIRSIKKVMDSMIIMFSPINLPCLLNYNSR
jgi:hypothetical protein